MKNRSEKKKGTLSLIAGLVLFVLIAAITAAAVKNVSISYHSLKEMDLSSDVSGSMMYYDHLYGAMACGIEIDRNDSNKAVQMADFLASGLKAINKRMLSCTLLYAMMIVTVMAFWLYSRFGQNKEAHTLSAVMTVLIMYALLILVIVISHIATDMPFYFPSADEWPVLAASILSVIGGSCFLAWVFRLIRFKRSLAAAAIPVVFLLFIFGSALEGQLYSPRTTGKNMRQGRLIIRTV